MLIWFIDCGRRKEVSVNNSCSLNHHSLTELFQQATIKIKQDYQTIYKDSETSRKCFDCHNRERNYQILLNLLERYWIKVKRLEKPSFVGDQKGEPSM